MVDVQPKEWQDLLIPFQSLVPVVRTRSVPEGQRTPLALDRISAIQVCRYVCWVSDDGWRTLWIDGLIDLIG